MASGEFQQALREIDDELTDRIRGLRATQGRLRQLAAGQLAPLPTDVGAHLENLACWGFTPRWVDLQRDLFAHNWTRDSTCTDARSRLCSEMSQRAANYGADVDCCGTRYGYSGPP